MTYKNQEAQKRTLSHELGRKPGTTKRSARLEWLIQISNGLYDSKFQPNRTSNLSALIKITTYDKWFPTYSRLFSLNLCMCLTLSMHSYIWHLDQSSSFRSSGGDEGVMPSSTAPVPATVCVTSSTAPALGPLFFLMKLRISSAVLPPL